LTNGATLAPGINGAGTLTVAGTNLIWYGGARYVCDVTNLYAGPGVGWDLLNVSNRLVLLPGNTSCVISVESQGNIPVGAADRLDFNLLVMTVKTGTDLDLSMVSLRTNDFKGAQYGDWGITNIGTNLYLTYRSTDPVGGSLYTWDAPSNGNWTVSSNWISRTAPVSYSPSMLLQLGAGESTPGYSTTNNFVGNFMLNRLTLNNANAGASNVLNGSTIEFWNDNALLEQVGASTMIISNPVNLKTDLTLGGNGSTGILAGVITGTGSLTKVGTSTMILSSGLSNTFIGGVTVGGGPVADGSGGVVELQFDPSDQRDVVDYPRDHVWGESVSHGAGDGARYLEQYPGADGRLERIDHGGGWRAVGLRRFDGGE
jgi:hypothetical protein